MYRAHNKIHDFSSDFFSTLCIVKILKKAGTYICRFVNYVISITHSETLFTNKQFLCKCLMLNGTKVNQLPNLFMLKCLKMIVK